jgi:hypothetical protein
VYCLCDKPFLLCTDASGVLLRTLGAQGGSESGGHVQPSSEGKPPPQSSQRTLAREILIPPLSLLQEFLFA